MGRLPDGRAVFVPFTIPGEKVNVKLIEEKRGFAKAQLLEVIASSPLRIPPRCKHYSVCGGCHYQHIPYDQQLKEKIEILKDQLTRLGGLGEPNVLEIEPSPLEWRYRNHVQFHIHPEGGPGFQMVGGEEIVKIEECFLPDDEIESVWHQFHVDPESGLDYISFRSGEDGAVQIILDGEGEEPPEFELELPLDVVYLGDDEMKVLSGIEDIPITILGKTFRVTAGAFFQVNTRVAEKMVAFILEQVQKYKPLDAATDFVDLYCGVGLFSAFFAPLLGNVIGVESSPVACEDYAYNLDEFENVSLYEGNAEDILPYLEIKADVLLVDPPRGGLHPKVMDAILNLSPGLLVYVSCDPATLARDAKKLTAGGYILKQIKPFDMFPQTYHIESVSFWIKE